MSEPIKIYNTVGGCGIDCGMCPRFYTAGSSRCPGCGGAEFLSKHPPCGHLSCCIEHGVETCATCEEYPCIRVERAKQSPDSFVTHRKIASNLEQIYSHGIEEFLSKQSERITILEFLLSEVDNGRSKSFYCLACALLPLSSLHEVVDDVRQHKTLPKKDLDRRARNHVQDQAKNLGIVLQLEK